MNTDTSASDLKERYSSMETEELVLIYQQRSLTDTALPILEAELLTRSVNLDILSDSKIKTPQEIDREVFKDRGKTALINLMWKIIIRVILPLAVIFSIVYAQKFWGWVTEF